MSSQQEHTENLLEAEERGLAAPSRSSKTSTLFTPRLRLASAILLLVFIVVGVVAVFVPLQKTHNNSKNDESLPRLRSGGQHSPLSMGHMNVYVRKSRSDGYHRRPTHFRFPTARFSRDRFPLHGPFLSFAPWLPMFADRLTRQTIIFVPTGGVYILPPLVNFYGKLFSVAELIASGYASLVSDGAPMTALPNIAPFFHPMPLHGAGIPRINPLTGSFIGGVRTKFDSFDIPRHRRRIVYIDRSRESEERYDDHDSDDDEESYERPYPVKRKPSGTTTQETTTVKDEIVPIQWKACSKPILDNTHVECASLSVPMDHARPHGTKIQTALAIVRHTVPNDRFQGAILIILTYGSSGISRMSISQYFPENISGSYDWIGVDARGSGSSEPSLSCLSNYWDPPFPPYIPTDQNKEDAWLNRSKAYAQACGKKHGKLLEHMSTVDLAKDIERIRLALGHEQISLFGIGQGTYISAVYATLYPQRVRRMVLDSNIDPRQIWLEFNFQQNLAADYAARLWFQWLAKYDRVYHLGDTEGQVEFKWRETMQALEAHRADGLIGQSEWTDFLWAAAIDDLFWEPMAEAFSAWVHKENSTALVNFYLNVVKTDEKQYVPYVAAVCTDAQWPQDWNNLRLQNWRSYAKAPAVTWSNAWFNGPCQYWPAEARTPIQVDGSKVNAILLLGATRSAIYPYEGSLEVRRRFPQSKLVAVTDFTDNSVAFKDISCVDRVIEKYLATGELPTRKSGDRADVTCTPPPAPIPAALN